MTTQTPEHQDPFQTQAEQDVMDILRNAQTSALHSALVASRTQVHYLRAQVSGAEEEIAHLQERVAELEPHLNQAAEDDGDANAKAIDRAYAADDGEEPLPPE